MIAFKHVGPAATKHSRNQCGQGRFGEEGSSLIEAALLLPLLLLLLAGAVDYGRGSYAAIEVSAAAEAGALYGTLNPTDTAGMIAMAQLDAKDVNGMTATATFGCECADGSSVSVGCLSAINCSTNVVKYVEVTTAATYTPMMPYPGIPAAFNLSGKSRMRASVY